jgi:TolB-like protein/DNA-binding winged helix-turn-helix (wHTH) protein/Tfp pilus assembly protein PilF
MTTPAAQPFRFRFGSFELDRRAGELRRHGIKVRLQEKPLRLLEALLEHPGQAVTREELRGRLWAADTFVDVDNGLNTAVNKLRAALGDSADDAKYVETLGGRGYRFVAPVEALVVEPERKRSWRTALLAGSIVLAAGVATYYAAWSPAGSRTAHVRLAILPFENLTGDPDQDFFCDGLTEEMIANLGSLNPQRLSVIARGSVMRYKSRAQPLEAIGRELDVDYIVQGSVRRERNRVRISTQLTDISRRAVIWVRSYDRDLRDVLALQGEVALAVAGEIEGELALGVARNPRKTTPANFEAYEAYLRGRYFWNQRSAEGLRKAIEYFQEAVRLDPGYAAAYAGIAQSYGPLGYSGYVPPAEALAGMRGAVARALAIDNDLVEAHTARALLLAFHEWRLADAEPAFRRALALNTSDATARSWYAQYLIAAGRRDEALAESRRATELDPLSLWINSGFGSRLYWARRFDDAIAQCRKTLELDPAYFAARTCLALAYAQQGAHEEAVRELERAGAGGAQTSFVLADLGYVYARAGRSEDAHNVLTELTDRSAREYVPPYALALVHAGLGENGRAMEWLERAGDERSPRMVFLNVEPRFDGLRADPRFKRLVQRIALPARGR